MPGGIEEIQRYDCGAGFEGMPGGRFQYTSISDDSWNNDRCNTENTDAGDSYNNNSFL